MWKWTDPDNIKVVILDCDSLDEEFINFDYYSAVNHVIVHKIKSKSSLKNNIYSASEYYDLYSELQKIIITYNVTSNSIICISKDLVLIKEMMLYHIGTIYADSLNRKSLEYVPDFTSDSVERLDAILRQKRIGYGAKVYAVLSTSKKRNLLINTIDVELDNGKVKNSRLFIGGRYYSKSKHNYLKDDPLSVLLLNFKDNYVAEIDEFYDAAILYINNTIQKFDLITYVPSKPKEISVNKVNRFSRLYLPRTKDIISMESILECTDDFVQKNNDGITREEVVKGKFKLKDNINIEGKNIILLDDLISTGSTIKENIRVLYENGANNVVCILLAVNQTTDSSSTPYKPLICPKCNGKLTLKKGKYGLFFGCENHKEIDCGYSIGFIEGLKKLKEINILEVSDVDDLSDEY